MVWNIDPIIFSLGPLTVRWYGLFFVIGFSIAYKVMEKIFKRDGLPTSELDTFLVYSLLGTMIGARLGHCFFYEPEYYFSHPLEIFAVWRGGLASHGGFLGVGIAIWLFSRKSQIPLLYLLDKAGFLALFGGSLIRLGNLMNSEIIGKPTDVPWAFVFTRVDNIPRHPTQIYESLSYLLIAVVAWILEKKKHKTLPQGFLFGFILFFGFLARFVVEFFKENQEQFEQGMTINMGQILSILPVLAGAALMAWSLLKNQDSIKTTPKQKKKKSS